MIKYLLSIFLAAGLIALSVYSDVFKKLSIPWQIGAFVILGSAQAIVSWLYDHGKKAIDNSRLTKKNISLKTDLKSSKKALSELQTVMINFIENSEVYRQRVKDYLGLNEDYLCIIKSSEGLSDVFDEMEDKTMLPFTKILSEISGSIRPFERISMFLIPVSSLPGLKSNKIRAYINKNIIPLVEKERQSFLGEQPRKVRKLADKFSYKYIAFLIRQNAIAYETRNRKFNHDFSTFIVSTQSPENVKRMKDDMEFVLKSKDFLLMVNWSSFVNLNKEQATLIDGYKEKLYKVLKERRVVDLNTLSQLSKDDLAKIFLSVFKKKTTKIKASHLAERVLTETIQFLTVLRKNGAKI